MAEHSKKSVWIPPSKPGPSHPIGVFHSALERCKFDPSKSDWEQLYRFGPKDVETVWNHLENREGLQHPLTPS